MIEEMGLGEVIQALSLNRHRGTLRIEGDEGISKFFYLSDGEIVLIRTVKSEPVRIGELLVRAGKIDHEQLEAALTLQKETKQRLGDALIALGHVTSQDVDQVVRGKFEEEFLDVFLLDRGHFEFIFGLSPESLFSPDEKLERIALNTSSLMLEAMRRVDDWQSMRRELGSLDEIYKNRVEDMAPHIEEYTLDNVSLAPNIRREIYELLDGRRTIREALAAAQNQGASRLHAFAFIHACKLNDLIRPLDAGTCLGAAKEALDKGDASETAKYIRAVMAKERIEIALIRRYIEFLRKAERPQLARRECKTLAAQYLTDSDVDNAILLYQLALEVDPRDTEVLDRLFYAHLRKSDVRAALEVGYMFRDYMSRENDLPIVARVVKNMRELEPDDPRVLEVSGLLLKRQERVEESRRELEKALAALKKENGSIERQTRIVQALLELDPKQAALAREKEKLERDALVAAAHTAAKKRIRVVLAAGGVIVAVLLAIGEVRARLEMSEADGAAANAQDLQAKMKLRYLYDKASHRISTVSGLAQEKAAAIQASIDDELSQLNTKHGVDRARVDKEKEEAERRAKAEKTKQEVTSALAEIDAAKARKDWAAATKLAIALHHAHKADDPRAANVTVPIRVNTTPTGARAWIEGATPPQSVKTPGVLEAPVAKRKVTVKMSRPGYSRLSVDCEVDGERPMGDVDLPLVRGAAWRAELEGQIAGALAAGEDRGIAVCRDGRVYAVNAEDGSHFWTRQPDAADPLGEPAAPGIAQGVALVGGRSGLLLGLDLASGQVKWRLKGEPILHPPLGVELDGRERAVVCRGNTLAVIDASQGTIEREVPLTAAPAAQPVAHAGRAVAVLVDGRAVLVDLVAGKPLWNVDAKVDPVGAPVLATELGFVLMASREGAVIALSLTDGATKYRRTADLGPLEGGLSVDDRAIYVSTTRGRLLALDVSDGRTLWDQLQPAVPAAPPRRFSSSVYVPLRTGEIVELNPSDGKKRGSVQVEGIPSASPVICGTRLLLGAGFSVFALERAED